MQAFLSVIITFMFIMKTSMGMLFAPYSLSGRSMRGCYRRLLSHAASGQHVSAAGKTEFGEIGTSHSLVAALRSQNMRHPTEIQLLSYKAVQGGGDVIIGAETGSGKTFAYMLPLIDKAASLLGEQSEGIFLNSPLAVVLAPNKDLCRQICSMCSGLLGSLAEHGPHVRVGTKKLGKK